MKNQRLNIRLKYEWQCNVHLTESSYSATTKNISSSGVLVHFPAPLSDVHVGDKCILSLNRGLLLRYDSEVVRVGVQYCLQATQHCSVVSQEDLRSSTWKSLDLK